VQVEVRRHLDDRDIAAVQGLLDRASAHDGHQALGEHQWLDLVQGGREGFAGVLACEPGHDHPLGYAQVSRSEQRPRDWALEVVVAPHHREDTVIGDQLIGAALDVVAEEGGGHVHLWVPKPQPWHDRVTAAHGLRRGRELFQMRCTLPTGLPYELEWRPFAPGRDEDAWLEVNNGAFGSHPEQGGWTRELLEERKGLPWFDASGFLLHDGADGRVDGFCWTKVHAEHDPPLGEIYVIAVAPWAQGQGLGRRLVLAGLDHLAQQGLEHGMLYVDGANRAAVKLYFDVGFHLDHVDRAYTADVDQA
jgi:mycothiol synthase